MWLETRGHVVHGRTTVATHVDEGLEVTISVEGADPDAVVARHLYRGSLASAVEYLRAQLDAFQTLSSWPERMPLRRCDTASDACVRLESTPVFGQRFVAEIRGPTHLAKSVSASFS